MKKQSLFFLLSIFQVFYASAQIQDKDSIHSYQINEVRVTAQAIPSVSRSPSPLQVMTNTDMERIGVLSVSDAVRRFAGVALKDYGGIGGAKTVSVRGLGDQHTAVLYDGVAFSDSQSGAIDIGRFSLDNVSFISLNIGQSDDIFQSAKAFASASTLNIKTSNPAFSDKNYKAKVGMKTGSWGFFNPSAFLAYRLSSLWATTLNGNWQRADGNYPFKFDNGQSEEKRKRYNSDVNTWRTELNVYGDMKKAGRLQLKASYYDSERSLPGAAISDNTEAFGKVKNRDILMQANYENDLNPKFSLKGFAKYSDAYNKYSDLNSGTPFIDKYYQAEYSTSIALLYKSLDKISLSLAQDYGYTELTSKSIKSGSGSGSNLEQDPTRNTIQTAFNIKFSNRRFTVISGLLGSYIDEHVKLGDRPKNKSRLSPSFSVSYKPFDIGLRVRASLKDVYRVPTFNEMYYFNLGSISLHPEKSKQYNIGTTYVASFGDKVSLFNISVDGYLNKVKDKIIIFAAGPLMPRMTNRDNVTIKGIDVLVSTQVNLSSDLQLFLLGAYSYQSSKDDETKSQIPYTPEHSGSGSIGFENPWLKVTYSFLASGKRYSQINHTQMSRLEAYYDQSISVNRTFNLKDSKLRLQAELLNLSNKNYQIIKGYPMPGRSFRISTILMF